MKHLKAITILKIHVKNLENEKSDMDKNDNSVYAAYLKLEIDEMNETINELQKL